jgi:hypothetical protein
MTMTAMTPANEPQAAVTGYRRLPRFPVCAPQARARTYTRARAPAHAQVGGYTPKRGNPPVTGNRAKPPSVSVTILHHCRCQDCRHWDDAAGRCEVCCLERYVPMEDYHPAMQPFWSDLGMTRPEQWCYCSDYHGPQISKDVWVCPRRQETRGLDMCI